MNYSALYHRPRNEYAYFEDGKTVQLMLRTQKDDLKEVLVCWFDKYLGVESMQNTPMVALLSDSDFSYYKAKVTPPYRRLAYYFRLTDNTGKTYFLDELGHHSRDVSCIENAFQIPYLNTTDAIEVPSWAKSAVFYQIFPDSFACAAKTDRSSFLPWNGEPHIIEHLGGNLRGILEHFDHIVNLGINAIYFCPIFVSNSCHRYNTSDYYTIDPRLGTLDDFRELLDTCHSHGIRVILDAVFNHSCDTFPQFLDVIKKGEDSNYKDWYFIHEYPVLVDETYRYERFAFEPHMPKLNTANPQTRAYLLDVARYWTRMGIDGWRLDVANEVDLDFWREFRKAVKEISPDAFILGEMWNDSLPYLSGDMMDSVMNYPFATACRYFFLEHSMPASKFRDIITRRLVCYPQPMAYAMYNLFGSHDTARWLTLAKNDIRRVMNSIAFQFCMPGMPAIYYGDETAMQGADFIQARRCMDFTPAESGQILFALYRALIRLRRQSKTLCEGNFAWIGQDLESETQALALCRTLGEEQVHAFFNNSDETITFSAIDTFKDSDKLTTDIIIPALSFRIFVNGEEFLLPQDT